MKSGKPREAFESEHKQNLHTAQQRGIYGDYMGTSKANRTVGLRIGKAERVIPLHLVQMEKQSARPYVVSVTLPFSCGRTGDKDNRKGLKPYETQRKPLLHRLL